MPRTEDDRYGAAVVRAQSLQEVAHVLHPQQELAVLNTTGQNALYCHRVLVVPCRAAGIRVSRMPRQCDYAAPLVVRHEFLTYACEGHGVKVLVVAHLYASEVKAHDGGIVARSLLGIAASTFPLPCQSIERVVLMPEHITAHLQLLQSVKELLTESLS